MRLLAISGSLRADSHNSRLLRIAAEEAPAGVEVEIYDGLAGIPPYDEDRDTARGPAPVLELRELIAASDGLVFATPNTTLRCPASSRTPSTGPHGPGRRHRWQASPRP